MTVTTDRLYRHAVDERYRVLRNALALAQRRPDWGLRLDQTAAIRAEIRALVRVRWTVRRTERLWLAQDAVHVAKAASDRSYHDWQAEGPALTEDELWGGYGGGFQNPEGDPTLNGAFR